MLYLIEQHITFSQVQEENNQCTLYFERDTLNTICQGLSQFAGYSVDMIPDAIKVNSQLGN